MKMKLSELLEWSLRESDNNAADILIKYVGGVNAIQTPEGIKIGASENDMHTNPATIYQNVSTPLAMAEFLNRFMQNKEQSTEIKTIASIMETCRTGSDRLAAPLTNSDITIGHKTGTGDTTDSGRISAVNDCGYIILPDGQSYSIAVFIADSTYTFSETEHIIANLSSIILNFILNK